jgi:streptogrisin C
MNTTRTHKIATAAAFALFALLAQEQTASAGGLDGPAVPPSTSQKVDPQTQAVSSAADEKLRQDVRRATRAVGAETGGVFVAEDGALVVTVTSDAAARKARANGADRIRRVDDTEARLDRIMDVLNRWSKRNDAGSVQSWRVDVPSNSVLVTLTEKASDKGARGLTALARRFGDSVRFESRPASAMAAPVDSIYGGLEYRYMSGSAEYLCSTGFAGLDSANRNIVLTAGHCLTSRPVPYRNGYQIGSTKSFQFGPADWGVFYNQYPTWWQPYAAVATYNGSTMAVRGTWGAPPIGATSCKSGRTTGWTCGVIQAKNVTVRYDTGQTLYGMVQHNACTEGGDSGGSVMSSGGYALGLTSGSSYFWLNGKKVCGAKVGRPNVSYYQPIAPVLSATATRIYVTG